MVVDVGEEDGGRELKVEDDAVPSAVPPSVTQSGKLSRHVYIKVASSCSHDLLFNYLPHKPWFSHYSKAYSCFISRR